MKYAVYIPNFGPFVDVRFLMELAREAEEAGWDGFFIWDHMQWTAPRNFPMIDPWIALSVIAANTSRIRLGAIVTPVARRRPWKLSREIVTLDNFSGGRMVMGAGGGHDVFQEYSAFGEPVEDRTRGDMLDEGLDVITGLWAGKPFSYDGTYFHINNVEFLPTPVQQPRIPIWVAGAWPHKRPFLRAARWDGIVPQGTEAALSPQDIRDLITYIKEHRTADGPFDVVYNDVLLVDRAGAKDRAARYEDAGVTWWLENFAQWLRSPLEEIRELVRTGTPVE